MTKRRIQFYFYVILQGGLSTGNAGLTVLAITCMLFMTAVRIIIEEE